MHRPTALLLVSVSLWAPLASTAFAEAEDAAGGEAPPASEEPASKAPPKEPITSISGSPPAETLQERMERFKREKGAGSDKPFEGFATQAEADMQRQRDEAISGPAQVAQQDAEAAVESRVERASGSTMRSRASGLGAARAASRSSRRGIRRTTSSVTASCAPTIFCPRATRASPRSR